MLWFLFTSFHSKCLSSTNCTHGQSKTFSEIRLHLQAKNVSSYYDTDYKILQFSYLDGAIFLLLIYTISNEFRTSFALKKIQHTHKWNALNALNAQTFGHNGTKSPVCESFRQMTGSAVHSGWEVLPLVFVIVSFTASFFLLIFPVKLLPDSNPTHPNSVPGSGSQLLWFFLTQAIAKRIIRSTLRPERLTERWFLKLWWWQGAGVSCKYLSPDTSYHQPNLAWLALLPKEYVCNNSFE